MAMAWSGQRGSCSVGPLDIPIARTHCTGLLLAILFLLLLSCDALCQVFGIRRPNVWYIQATPSLNIFVAHTGIDESAGTTVSDVFRWGAAATLDFGTNLRRFSLASKLRLDYEESHSSEEPPVKGPSIFDLAIRSLYNVTSDSTTSFGVAFQGGCYSTLFPETGGDGTITKRFFDPASLYEGAFLSREDQFGRQNLIKTSIQIGYSLQQLVYRNSENEVSGGNAPVVGTSAQNMGLSAFLTFEFVRQALTSNQEVAGSFFINLSAKGFKKDVGFNDWKNSRVEGAGRVGFSVFQILEFVTAAELVYDSDISPRRDLRTTVSITIKYDLAFSGKL